MDISTESLEFTVARDRRYLRRLAFYGSRRVLTTFVVVGAILLVSGLFLVVAEDAWGVLVGLPDVGLGAALVLSAALAVPTAVRRFPDLLLAPRTYRVTPEYIGWSSAYGSAQVRWHVVDRVVMTDFAYLLVQRGGLGRWDIPRTGLTAEQEQRLRAYLAIPAQGTMAG